MSPGGTLLLLFYGQQDATPPPSDTTRYASPETTKIVARSTSSAQSIDPQFTRIVSR